MDPLDVNISALRLFLEFKRPLRMLSINKLLQYFFSNGIPI